MPDHQNSFAVGVFDQQRLKVAVFRVEPQRRADLNLCVVSQLGAHKLRRLQGALQRA